MQLRLATNVPALPDKPSECGDHKCVPPCLPKTAKQVSLESSLRRQVPGLL